MVGRYAVSVQAGCRIESNELLFNTLNARATDVRRRELSVGHREIAVNPLRVEANQLSLVGFQDLSIFGEEDSRSDRDVHVQFLRCDVTAAEVIGRYYRGGSWGIACSRTHFVDRLNGIHEGERQDFTDQRIRLGLDWGGRGRNAFHQQLPANAFSLLLVHLHVNRNDRQDRFTHSDAYRCFIDVVTQRRTCHFDADYIIAWRHGGVDLQLIDTRRRIHRDQRH